MARSLTATHLRRLLYKALRHHYSQAGLIPSFERLACPARRSFIKGALGVGALAAAAPLGPVFAATGKPPSVAIIGAGMAGLTAAYHLGKAGIRAQIFEASNRPGGRVMSTTNAVGEGLTVDMGAELINLDHQDILRHAQTFGIKLFNRHEDARRFAAPAQSYYFAGRVVPEDELAPAMAPIAGQIAADARRLDENFDEHAPLLDSLSVRDYLNRHAALTRMPLVRHLLENSIRSEYGCEPSRASALLLIYNLPVVDGTHVEMLGNSDETYAVVGGTQAITDALARAVEEQISFRTVLSSVRREGGQYALIFERDPQPLMFDYVILTLPFSVLRKIDLQVPVPQKMRQFIAQADLGRNEKLMTGYRRAFWRKSLFAQGLCTDGEYSQIWDPCQRQGHLREGALTFYLGGSQAAAMGSFSAEDAGKHVTQGLEKLDPRFVCERNHLFLMTSWTKNRFSNGAYSTFAPGQLTAFSEFFWVPGDSLEAEQEVRFDNLLFCGEHLSDAFFGFMNGAAETGRLAARSVASSALKR